jgi:hypothetical protein
MTDDNDVLVVQGKKGRYVLADSQLIAGYGVAGYMLTSST